MVLLSCKKVVIGFFALQFEYMEQPLGVDVDGLTIYEKWLADHRDEQRDNGVLPSIIPTAGWGYEWGNGPDWTSTIAIIPWNLHLFYGDTRPLQECYDNLKRYVDHITEISPKGITDWGLGDWVP